MRTDTQTSRRESVAERIARELREDPATHPAPCWAPHTGCNCPEDGAR